MSKRTKTMHGKAAVGTGLAGGMCALLLLVGSATSAGANSFSNTVNFSTGNKDWVTVSDNNQSGFVGQYLHTLQFDPASLRMNSATLTIEYRNVSSMSMGRMGESWTINLADATSSLLGAVPGDNMGGGMGGGMGGMSGGGMGGMNNAWSTASFILPPSALTGLSDTLWDIGFKFQENTAGADSFELHKSTLAGEYDPVPEPATMILLGTGLAGLIAESRRKKA